MERRDPFAPFQITKKSRLTTKSDQWLDDSEYLWKSKRYAAALYLGGFVIEGLLEAGLCDRRFQPQIRCCSIRTISVHCGRRQHRTGPQNAGRLLGRP